MRGSGNSKGGRGDRVMGETEQRVQEKSKRGWPVLCLTMRALYSLKGAGTRVACVCEYMWVQMGRP